MLKHIILLSKKNPVNLEPLMKELESRGVRLWRELPQENLLMAELLFITDMKDVAKALLEQRVGVLVWLHEENRTESFEGLPYAVERLEEADFTYLDKVHRRFNGIPWHIADTSRCIIREMEEKDIDALYELYSDKGISKYTEDLYEDKDKEREYIRSYIDHAYTFWGFGTWLVERKEDHKVIGRVGFNLREGYEIPELGFVIGMPWQRQGLAYETCLKALEIGKRDYDFTWVQALVREENVPSARLCEKLGFSLSQRVIEQGREYLLYKINLAFL